MGEGEFSDNTCNRMVVSCGWMHRDIGKGKEAPLISLDIEIWSFEELGLSYMSPAIWVPGHTHMSLRNLVCKLELPYYLMSCDSGGVKFNLTNQT